MSTRPRFALVSGLAGCILFASAARGQSPAHARHVDAGAQLEALKEQQAILQSPNQFGVLCCQILQIPASSFVPWSIGDAYVQAGQGYVYTTGSDGGLLWASVTLPSGAALDYLDLYYYDVHPTYDICAQLMVETGPTFFGDPPGEYTIATTCSSGAPGYGYAAIAASGTINNDVYFNTSGAQYVVLVGDDLTSTSDIAFKGVDIWWHRQVSPAPATATFNDVPTNHPFFQFVEALAASGITAGCQANPPLYCPDAPLTRKQMAAFLSKGFGLYWPY